MNIWQKAWHAILGDSLEPEPIADDGSDETTEAVAPAEEILEYIAPIEAPPEVEKILVLKGHLPSNFPALDKLHEAGINTYGQLAKLENLRIVVGIGPKTAEKIADRLVEDLKNQG